MHTLVVPASSYSDQSLTGTIGQSEEETEELSKITLENKDIQLDINIRVFDGADPMELHVYDFKGPGVTLSMYNSDEFIRPFAKSSMDMALSKKSSLHLSTKNTIIKKYDDRHGSSMFLQARGHIY
ncbi:ATPase 4 plasma membrane-type [Zea mays]|uniref:ATPase 4 plasma membrane-type n=1 Tax=Zea mays TaxID=4577 RepID=A0A1D6I7U1_MAIZE|nr:ATPase 4 plasma membrane-type [Zea mays]